MLTAASFDILLLFKKEKNSNFQFLVHLKRNYMYIMLFPFLNYAIKKLLPAAL